MQTMHAQCYSIQLHVFWLSQAKHVCAHYACTIHKQIPYSGKFSWVQIFANLPKIRSYKVFAIFNFATKGHDL